MNAHYYCPPNGLPVSTADLLRPVALKVALARSDALRRVREDMAALSHPVSLAALPKRPDPQSGAPAAPDARGR